MPQIGRQTLDRPARGLVLPRLLRWPTRRVMRALHDGSLFSLRALKFLLLAAILAGAAAFHDSAVNTQILARLSVMAGFTIGDIEVTGGSEVSKIDVLANLDLGVDRPLFTFDVHAARQALKQLPWVFDARVAKNYPDKLTVRLKERVPVAIWQHEGQLRIISRDGFAIAPFEPRFAGLPLVVGAGANEAAGEVLTLGARFAETLQRVRAYVRIGGRRWNLLLDNDVEVLLPENGVEEALAELAALQARYLLLDKDIVQVDLRLAERLVVRLSETGLANAAETAAADRNAGKAGRSAI